MKKGFIGKVLIAIIIVVVLLLLLVKLSRADTFTYYNNVSVSVNTTDFNVKLSNSYYFFYYNNSNYDFNISQPIVIEFNPVVQNITYVQNITSNLSCASNNTLQVSCLCPSLSCPSIAANNCSLAPDSISSFNTKIEEGYNKAANDIVFRLEPTKLELDNLRQIADNSTQQKNVALLEANKQLEQNIRLGEVIQSERRTHDAEISSLRTERMLLFIANIIMASMVIYLLSDAYGLFDRLRNLGFRRRGW